VRNTFKFSIAGADAAAARLRDLPPKLHKKGLPRAARAAMKIVQDAARASARGLDDPTTDQKFWRLIQIRKGRLRGPGVRMRVGVVGGAISSRSKTHPWYWRLIELGTETQPAKPFMRPALETNAKAVADRFARELNVELDILSATER
jgi:HK97 gp10 family phage protein